LTLDEAIETITSIKHVCRGLLPPKEQDALSIGIEALKLIDNLRFDGSPYYPNELPGETKD